jgi:hypothetical protein
MNYRKTLVLLILLFPIQSKADMTGAGDAAILAQLAEMTAQAVEQLKTLKETMDIQEQLKQLQQLDGIKELSESGKSLGEIFGSVRNGAGIIESMEGDPFGVDAIDADIAYMEQRIESAKEKDDLTALEIYADVLKDLKKVQWLGKTNENNATQISNGVSKDELEKIGAESGLITSTVITDMLKKSNAEDAANAQITEILMSGYGYNFTEKGNK